MLRKLNHAAGMVCLLGISIMLSGFPAAAAPPMLEEVLEVLGMDKESIAELAQGQPVAYALNEDGADELAAGVVWYLPVTAAKVAGYLRQEYPESLDVDVIANGMLTAHGNAASLAAVTLSEKETEALLNAEQGDEFNLSAEEIDSFNNLKQTLNQMSDNVARDAVLQHYREILFQRFEAYRHGGTNAIEPYVRKKDLHSRPSLELRQAANANAILIRYLPTLHKAWLDYPKALPPGAVEAFPWVEKNVQGRPAVILRHRVHMDWNGGVLVLTREFYAPHSYNASQWITGFLPYHDGTVVFQQVRSYTDQVAGAAREVKHMMGRKLLKDKMLESFEHFCRVLGQCG